MQRSSRGDHPTSDAVLVQQSGLGEIEREELAEITNGARAAKATESLPKKHRGDE
jgi:hypothetical protein